MHEGAITPPTYPAPNSVAQFGTEAFLYGQSTCCTCHEECHKCSAPAERVAAEEEPVKPKKKAHAKKKTEGEE